MEEFLQRSSIVFIQARSGIKIGNFNLVYVQDKKLDAFQNIYKFLHV